MKKKHIIIFLLLIILIFNIDIVCCEDYPNHLEMTKNQDHYWLRKKKDVFMFCLGEFLGKNPQEMEIIFYDSTNQKFRQSFNHHLRTCMTDTAVKDLAVYYYENFYKNEFKQ